MRKITLMLFAVFALAISWQSSAQVQVGDGTNESQQAPFEPYYGYSYGQSIYLASEINASGDITGIQWYFSGTSTLSSSQDLTIYIGHTSKTEFSSTSDWEPVANLTQVYTGGITVAGTGWVTLTFDTPFSYNGTDNLIVAADENMSGYDSIGDDFHNTAVSAGRSICYYSDSTNPDPASPPAANSGIDAFVPNVIFEGIAQACPTPSGMTATNVTDTTADLTWTAGDTETSWNLEWSEGADFTPGTGAEDGFDSVSGTPTYIGNGLTPNTTYYIYYQADCGGVTSAWAGPLTFTTACSALTAPYTEDFETFTVSSSAFSNENCWTATNLGSYLWEVAATTDTSSSGTGPASGVSDGNYLFTESSSGSQGDSIDLVSPLVDLSGLTTPALYFDYHMFGGSMGTLDVVVFDGTNTSTILSIEGQQQTAETDPFLTQILDLSAYAGQTVQVTFRGIRGSSYESDMSIDNVSFDEAPSCLPPSGMAIVTLTDTTVDLQWNAGGSETAWNLEWAAGADFDPGTGAEDASDSASSSTYNGTGLTEQTTYYVYYQADCGGNGASDWVGPFTFTTPCSDIVPEYNADMSNNPPDACWDEAGSGEVADGPSGFGASDWRSGTSYALGSSNAINLYSNSDREWLLSPNFDLSAGGPYQLIVNVAVTNWNAGTTADSMGSDDEVQLLMTTDGGSSWTNLTTWNATNEPPVGGVDFTYDLSAQTGSVAFAIFASDGTVDDSEDYDFHVGKFLVRETPSCLEPTGMAASNITTSSVELNWNAGDSETAWNLEWAEGADFTPGTGAEDGFDSVSGSPTYSGTGLTADTTYYVYYQADCGGNGTSPWVGPYSFSTPCDTASIPFTEDFEGSLDFGCGSAVNEGSGNTWTVVNNPGYGFTTNALRYSYSFSSAADTWYFTQGINLTAGSSYTISYDYGSTGSYPENLQVAYGTDASSTAMTTQLADHPGIDQQGPINNEVDFTPTTTGVYYFGFQAYSTANQWLLMVDNISITEATLSVEESQFSNFQYYPNPVQNTLTLNAQNTIENVAMYNMLGQEVLKATPNAVNSELDMSNLQDGTYFVKVTIANTTKTIRVVKN